MGRVVSWEEAARLREEARGEGRVAVFTNGCFDLLHRGHVDLLRFARDQGDLLFVGLNDDESVRRLKGEGRPLVCADDRGAVLAALAAVDYVVVFGEDTPRELIERLLPDVLLKGADYREEDVVGADAVKRAGGKVVLVPLTEGRSTTGLLRRLTDPPASA